LKMKNEELETQWQKFQMLQKEAAEGKALQETLTHMTGVLSEREGETQLYREQVRMLEEQKEMDRTALNQVMKDMAEKNQQVQSQQDQIWELQKHQELQRTVVSEMSKELEEREQEIRSQQKRIAELEKQRSCEEKTEERMNVLHRDLEYTKAILKEKDFLIESQKEVIESLQNQQQDSEQQKEMLQHLQVALKEQEQEILSLRKQCEAYKEKEEEHEAMQTKAIRQKLECAESSLEARDQEIVSLQEHVQDLQEQKELEGKQAKSLQQDLDKMSQIVKENCLEFLQQTEQINMFQSCEENMKIALTSCQKQVNLLEEVMRKGNEDNEEELKTLQNLQVRLSEKTEEFRHHREQEKLLEEVWPERGRETKVQGEQRELEEEIRALREELQHVQQSLPKKEEELKHQ
ncbi:CP250 protein, partial [Alopecoenas beccarii]|nr:CP250 protein [Alopecoenas beccarii]